MRRIARSGSFFLTTWLYNACFSLFNSCDFSQFFQGLDFGGSHDSERRPTRPTVETNDDLETLTFEPVRAKGMLVQTIASIADHPFRRAFDDNAMTCYSLGFFY